MQDTCTNGRNRISARSTQADARLDGRCNMRLSLSSESKVRDRQTDGRTDVVQRIMRPPMESRIIRRSRTSASTRHPACWEAMHCGS